MGSLIVPDRVEDRDALIDRAVGWRCGVAVSVDSVPSTPADPPIEQCSAGYGPLDVRVPAGGAARDRRSARNAAIGELLERYAAARFPIMITDRDAVPGGESVLDHQHFALHSADQQQHPDFPHRDSYLRTERTRVHSLLDNSPVWVPANLVSNDPDLGHLATSNGLAAGPTTLSALLRATQELIERDALMVTWLHQVGARRVPILDSVAEIADPVGAAVTLFDITPDYSPHPVAAVAGTCWLAGRPRNAFGLACRETFADAAAKAALEWAQGVSFAGVNTAVDPAEPTVTADQVNDFDQHAVFYTRRPDLWDRLPIWSGPELQSRSTTSGSAAPSRPVDQLVDLVHRLAEAGIDLFYTDLTTPDLAGCGVRAVRVLSPQLVPIHSDHRWPHLGGPAADLTSRYSWSAPGRRFPSDLPHPLG